MNRRTMMGRLAAAVSALWGGSKVVPDPHHDAKVDELARRINETKAKLSNGEIRILLVGSDGELTDAMWVAR